MAETHDLQLPKGVPNMFQIRGCEIRTHGLIVPNDARYQAALIPEFETI